MKKKEHDAREKDRFLFPMGWATMKKKKTREQNDNQTSQTDAAGGLTLSRRQFSLGVSGIVLVGAGGEVLPHPAANVYAHAFPGVSTVSESQTMTPHAFHQPQYTLSETRGCFWSPDGCMVATFQENRVTLHDAGTGKESVTYSKHTDEVLTVKWSGDGRYLASSGFDPVVHVWDAALAQTVTLYQEHTHIVREVAWSPNQQYLASAGYDKTVQVWEAFTGRPLVTFRGHGAEIVALAWSPDSTMIASTDLQNTTIFWRLQ